MNIFWLDKDPGISARYHHDKHVVKMVLETAQILSTALHLRGVTFPGQYKPTHRHHPCVVWAAESTGNLFALYTVGAALGREYTHRYGRTHKSAAVIDAASMTLTGVAICGLTVAPACMPEEHRTRGRAPVGAPGHPSGAPGAPDNWNDLVAAYRHYYCAAKIDNATWTLRGVPEWVWTIDIEETP